MKKIIITLATFLVSLCVFAQNERQTEWENFKKQHDFNQYKQEHDTRFQSFKDSLNKEFAKSIDKNWEEFQVFVGLKRESKPEPEQLPVAPQNPANVEPITIPIDSIVPTPDQHPSIEELWEDTLEDVENVLDTSSDMQTYKNIDVNFYMQPLNFKIPTSYEQLLLGGISEHSVAKFWSDLSDGDFNEQIGQFKNQKQELNLNDWALYDLITSVSAETFPNKYAEQTIFSVFMLNQLGLRARIGRSSTQLVILISAQTTIYAVSYVICDNDIYYIFSLYPKDQQDVAAINTYSVTFPVQTYPLDLNIYAPIKFAKKTSGTTYTTDYWGDAIPFQINYNIIDFYSTYPQIDIAIYANAKMSEDLKDWVDCQIKPFLKELNEEEAINVLLNYVQTEFIYETDFQQFGYEKPFFCEENFFYPKNDCEDRAILLSYLVKNLVGSQMVLLDYPDHIATAVALSDDSGASGDHILVNGKKYYVCDPTYIGANLGETMPKYRKIKAAVIMLQ